MVKNFINTRFTKGDFLYLWKTLIGAAVCYLFYFIFPQYPIHWSLISVVLVFTPDNSNQLAYDRIKSNMLGASIGLLLFFIPTHQLISLLIGISLVILVGILIKLEKTLRPALAALIIILLEDNENMTWLIPLERLICVTFGCLVGLIIIYLFSFIQKEK